MEIIVAASGYLLAMLFAAMFVHSQHLLRKAWAREDWYLAQLRKFTGASDV